MVAGGPVGAGVGGARAVARCDALGLAPYTDMADGLFRAYLSPAYRAAQATLAEWMAQAGMAVRQDAAANLIGRYEGTTPAAPALIIGSHLDSVRDGGRYDGPLGIMLGIEAVAALNDAGRRMPFPVEVYAFGDEEGSRFPAAMLTSRAVAGTLDAAALAVVDADGVALADAGVDIGAYLSAARRSGEVLAYLEAHIEQGPVLEAEGLAVGTVTGIAAQVRYRVQVTGQAGHAGTATMPLRRDALAGAAEMILAVERIAASAASDLVATVGRIEAQPGAANVIPGAVTFSLDVRAGEQARRDLAASEICAQLQEIARRRSLGVEVALVHDLPASPCDPALVDVMDAALAAAEQPSRRLVSGAGHDAMVMAALCPTAMLFIRCRGGVSHNPAEHVDPADAQIALAVMSGFIDRLGGSV
ncbi:allantoate amidohydrolase [Novosphingobium sp. FKTRR1]|uniref:allantoate amidohydrolase n=1 Tax=Novosphingobium sp. FKTRR1 TaxID=2879118 RepID=UPI001CF0007D|nr:allantoate amidohydrolase [Novosphingobium sp. FKTRR1]